MPDPELTAQDLRLIKWAYTSAPMFGLKAEHTFNFPDYVRVTHAELLFRVAAECGALLDLHAHERSVLSFTEFDAWSLKLAYEQIKFLKDQSEMPEISRVAFQQMAEALTRIYDHHYHTTQIMSVNMEVAFAQAAMIRSDLEAALENGEVNTLIDHYADKLGFDLPEEQTGRVVPLNEKRRRQELTQTFAATYRARAPQTVEDLIGWLDTPSDLAEAESRLGDPVVLARKMRHTKALAYLTTSLEEAFTGPAPVSPVLPFRQQRAP